MFAAKISVSRFRITNPERRMVKIYAFLVLFYLSTFYKEVRNIS